MSLDKYKALISKVLQECSGRKLTADQVAELVVSRISDVELILGSMPDVPILSGPQPKPDVFSQSIIGPEVGVSRDLDITQRVRTTEEEQPEFVERFTAEQLREFARDQMPSLLTVQPPGFDTAFEIRKFVEPAPGDLGYVRIVYQQEQGQMTTPDGQRIGPTIQIMTTDKRLDADALTKHIINQANSMYSKTQRVLVPVRQPLQGSGPGDLRNALGADIGNNEGADAAAMRGWSENLSKPSIGRWPPKN